MSFEIGIRSDCADRGSPLRSADASRVGIGHALVDDCTSEEVCTLLIEYAARGGKSAHVITPNAQHIVLLEKDLHFRQVYREADLVIADGASLLLAARLFGKELRERVAGVDIFRRLSCLAAQNELRVFLLGGRPGSADLAADALRREFPGLDCTTFCPPYGFEKSEIELKRVAEEIEKAKPHLLFVGLGAPKQENWIYNHGLKLSVPVSVGVGGSFEFVGGLVSRAPHWIRNLSLEWFYRLCCEPRRLWRRYLIGNCQFAFIVLHQRVRRAILNLCIRLVRQGKFAAELDEVMLSRSDDSDWLDSQLENLRRTRPPEHLSPVAR